MSVYPVVIVYVHVHAHCVGVLCVGGCGCGWMGTIDSSMQKRALIRIPLFLHHIAIKRPCLHWPQLTSNIKTCSHKRRNKLQPDLYIPSLLVCVLICDSCIVHACTTAMCDVRYCITGQFGKNNHARHARQSTIIFVCSKAHACL